MALVAIDKDTFASTIGDRSTSEAPSATSRAICA